MLCKPVAWSRSSWAGLRRMQLSPDGGNSDAAIRPVPRSVSTAWVRTLRFPPIPHALDRKLVDDEACNAQFLHPAFAQLRPPQGELPDRQLTDGQ